MSKVFNDGNINPIPRIPDTTTYTPSINFNGVHSFIMNDASIFTSKKDNYKYKELDILNDMLQYIDRTYGEHYKKEKLECLDAWIARGTASTTCLDTAEKYLWRYGSKKGKNKDDLMKALHYIMLTLYNDHYKTKGE